MRKLARESAFKIIYKSHFLKDNFDTKEILDEDGITLKEDIDFVNLLVDLYRQNRKEIDEKIETKSNGFEFDRIYKIDLAILELALAEILYFKQTPFKVVVNEAVEMSKKYSTQKSYSFVNGILKSVIEEENVV